MLKEKTGDWASRGLNGFIIFRMLGTYVWVLLVSAVSLEAILVFINSLCHHPLQKNTYFKYIEFFQTGFEKLHFSTVCALSKYADTNVIWQFKGNSRFSLLIPGFPFGEPSMLLQIRVHRLEWQLFQFFSWIAILPCKVWILNGNECEVLNSPLSGFPILTRSSKKGAAVCS